MAFEQPIVPMSGGATDWLYVGDTNSFDGLYTPQLVKSYNYAFPPDFSEFFQTLETESQTIIYEQVYETQGIMPVARYGLMPQGGFIEPGRVQRKQSTACVVREEDYLNQLAINQMRQVGTFNTRQNPQTIIEEHIKKLTLRAQRTETLMQAMCLQGHIRISHPGTATVVDVPSYIPAHNYFAYNNWVEDKAAGSKVNLGSTEYESAIPLVAKSTGRYEAAFFRSTDYKFGVDWLHERADITGCVRSIRGWAEIVNRVEYTDIIMSKRLLSIIMNNNQQLKAFAGMPALTIFNPATDTRAGNANYITNPARPSDVTFGVNGDINSLSGLRIKVVSGEYKDPNTGKYKVYWPLHLVCLVARQHSEDPAEKLGFMHYPIAENPDGTPGAWMRMGKNDTPFAPGVTLQYGNAFIPTLKYPHWVVPIVVCPPQTGEYETMGQNMMDFWTGYLRF